MFRSKNTAAVVFGLKKMIIVKLQGGLGNQMFQYAFARKLAYKHNVPLLLDKSSFEQTDLENTQRDYALRCFNIQERFASQKDISRFNKFKIKKPEKLWFLYNFIVANNLRYVSERQYNFDPKTNLIGKNAYINGFWQTEKYFLEIKNIIKNDFVLKKPFGSRAEMIATEIDNTKTSVSIHIRRGDFINNEKTRAYHGVCEKEYYNRAIKMICEKIHAPKFFVFSDDISWAKENMHFQFPVIYVSPKESKECEDLILMSKCHHNIIANSSFSWWGAWLNNNPQKIIIAPNKWVSSSKLNTKDILPDSWIKI